MILSLIKTKIYCSSGRLCASLTLQKLPGTLRKYSLEEKYNQPNDWKIIYKCPLMPFVSALSRLKIYQSCLTLFGLPITMALQSNGYVTEGFCLSYGAIGTTGILTLFLFSAVTNNLIGLIYINKENTQIKISSVDYWGKRLNKEFKINEFYTNSQIKRKRFGINYIEISGQSEKYKILPAYSIVMPPLIFSELFNK